MSQSNIRIEEDKMKPVELCYPNGKTKAFTISYDDGTLDDKKLLSLMEKYKIKGTFNLNSKMLGRKQRAVIDGYDTDTSTIKEQEVATLYKNQEIASHTMDHLDLTKIPISQIAEQVVLDQQKLESLVHESVLGFAYPFGCYNEQVIKELGKVGIQYARTVHNTYDFSIPQNFLKWDPTCHHNDDKLDKLLKKFFEIKTIENNAPLFYLWGHSYEFQQRDNWNIIEGVFAKLQKHENEIWFATNGEICRYIKAYDEVSYVAHENQIYNNSQIHLWVRVNGKIVSLPKNSIQKID